MHRAGTSMVAHLLHECGLYLGDASELLSASDENADGYWEHGKIVDLNNTLLAALGGSWSNPPPPDFPAALVDAHRAEALDITAPLQTAPLWGWKDPRTTL